MYHPMQEVEIEELQDPFEEMNGFYDDEEFELEDEDYPYEDPYE